MPIYRRTLGKLALGAAAAGALTRIPAAFAETAPKPFDKPKDVTIALVRYLSTGDFFEAYLNGVQDQAKALGVNLRVFDSNQNAALQSDMVDQAIALKVDGIILQHGLTESIRDAAQRALDAGIKVVAFDVNVKNPKIPQIDQDDRKLAELSLEQCIKDNGESFTAAYVYVPGIAPLDRRNETWEKFKKRYPGIKQVARFGTLDNPIPNSIANQALSVLQAHPDISVVFAPYDAFAKGVKLAVDEIGLDSKVKIYSADISTSDIAAMSTQGSPWVATAATNPAVVGKVCVRSLAMLLAGENLDHHVIIPPTLVTQKFLIDNKVKNMQELEQKLPSFAHADVADPKWIPLPKQQG